MPRPFLPRPALLAIPVALAALLGSVGAPARADSAGIAAIRRLLEDPDPAARAAAIRRIVSVADDASLRLVYDTMSDPHPYVRRAAAGILALVVDLPTRARLLREVPARRDPRARLEACRAFAAWADRDGRTGLLRALGDADPAVRAEALRWLAEDPDSAAGAALVAAVADPDGLVRAGAYDALVLRRGVKGAPPLDVRFSPGMTDKDPRARLSALEAAVEEGGSTAVAVIARGLADSTWSVRLAAAEAAGGVRERAVLPLLVEALSDPRDRVARAACSSLVRLTGIPFDADPRRWRAWLEADGAAFDPSQVAPRRAVPGFDPGGGTVAQAKFLDLPVASAHVSFVLDASGSMAARDASGSMRWDRVRDEMDRVLELLGTSAEGNVVLFSDSAQALLPSAVRYTPAVRAKVRTALAGRAPAGKTALYDGIALALADPDVDSIVVLSDGAPSAGEFFTKSDLRAELKRANRWRKARIDVVSIGSDDVAKRWRSLLRDVASDHSGRYLER